MISERSAAAPRSEDAPRRRDRRGLCSSPGGDIGTRSRSCPRGPRLPPASASLSVSERPSEPRERDESAGASACSGLGITRDGGRAQAGAGGSPFPMGRAPLRRAPRFPVDPKEQQPLGLPGKGCQDAPDPIPAAPSHPSWSFPTAAAGSARSHVPFSLPPLFSRIPFKIGQPKKQIVPKTVERDFEREYGKLQQLEDQTKKLQKDMKKSTDADLAMSKSAVKISSDLLANPLCEQDPAFLDMVTAFDTAMKRMDSFNQEKVNQIQKTVIEPLKKFDTGSVFFCPNVAVKRREQTLQDYRRLQAKVEKYEEKERTGPVLAKLHQPPAELGMSPSALLDPDPARLDPEPVHLDPDLARLDPEPAWHGHRSSLALQRGGRGSKGA
ncbi:PREDICTED: bridging integrator 3 [Tinamus guttatus]|uniref:bridging integrator 3 n=1 Tax=Tinamus guttatus TaxID=94827 RepID=UPI00052ED45F|nr:PREDICTED: bridging integrator 3 [Tinamus guttatus]